MELGLVGRTQTIADSGIAAIVDPQAHSEVDYELLEREVRANLVYRDFTHVGSAKMPDANTVGRWGLALGVGSDQTDSCKADCLVRSIDRSSENIIFAAGK